MSAAQLRPCPDSFAMFYQMLVLKHAPGQPGIQRPSVRDGIDHMLALASAAGYPHVDVLCTIIASGEGPSKRVLSMATDLGAAIGEKALYEFFIAFDEEDQFVRKALGPPPQ